MEMSCLHLYSWICTLSVDHLQKFPLPSTLLWYCSLPSLCPVSMRTVTKWTRPLSPKKANAMPVSQQTEESNMNLQQSLWCCIDPISRPSRANLILYFSQTGDAIDFLRVAEIPASGYMKKAERLMILDTSFTTSLIKKKKCCVHDL